MNVRFDLVSLDCTYATLQDNDFEGHMNLNANLKIKEQLISFCLADDNTIFIANHFSHQNGTYEQIKEKANKIGFLTAYDGMTVEF